MTFRVVSELRMEPEGNLNFFGLTPSFAAPLGETWISQFSRLTSLFVGLVISGWRLVGDWMLIIY